MILEGSKKIDKELKEEMLKIYEQAETHCTRDGLSDLIKQMRPTEPKSIQDYRVRNQRRITRESVEAWFSMISRIFDNSGIMVKNLSEKLTAYFELYPFKWNRKELSFFQWVKTVAMRLSVLDPNGIFVIYPKKQDYLNTLEIAMPQVKFFGCEDLVGAYGDYIYLAKEVGRQLHEHWLIGINDIRVLRDRYEGGKLVRDVVFEYNHNIGDYPIVSAMGITSVYEDEDLINESFLAPGFEYFDEALSQFSDNQGVTVQHNYPIRVLAEMPCKADGCHNGYVTNNLGETNTCGSCHGTGMIVDISPYHTVIAPDGMIGEGGKRDPVAFVAPPVSSITASYDRAFDLLKKGKEAIGLITLDVANTESGVSRAQRMESKQDNLLAIANNVKMFGEQLAYYYECYLEINEAQRSIPAIFVPKSLQIKDTETLMSEAINSPLADRYFSYVKYLNDKYNGDDEMIEVYKIALSECPLLMLTKEETQERMVSGIYSGFDLYKADSIVQTLMSLKDSNFVGDLKNRADEIIRENYSRKNRLNSIIG